MMTGSGRLHVSLVEKKEVMMLHDLKHDDRVDGLRDVTDVSVESYDGMRVVTLDCGHTQLRILRVGAFPIKTHCPTCAGTPGAGPVR